jgi:hypothetical protein
MPRPSYSSWFDHPNDMWWGVQSIKLLVMQSSSVLGSEITVLLLRLFIPSKSVLHRHPKSGAFLIIS